MSDPSDTDDGWASLYRELGVEGGEPAAKTPAPATDTALESEEEGVIEAELGDDLPADADAATDGDDDADGDEAEAGDEGAADGEPGEGEPKKRRRRRRRRKKKGGPGQPAAEGEATAAPAEAGDAVGLADDGEDAEEAEDAEPVAAVADEEPGESTAPDVIADWNVPSWGEIVAGLYRPDR